MEHRITRAIPLSRGLLCLLAMALAGLDWAVWPIVSIMQEAMPFFSQRDGHLLILCLYLCNIPAIVLLCAMNRLLKNLQAGDVFIPANVRLLHRIALCCFIACVLCLAGCLCFLPLGIVSIAVGFMGLIVRIVRDVFAQAVPMRDELDLTV